jgi:hypothetical protein
MDTTPPTIEFDALQPGDVLLFKGDGILSDAIMLLGDCDYSHAALFVGDELGVPHVIDAGRHGVLLVPLKTRNDEEIHCDAFRWHDNGLALSDTSPVVAVAGDYLLRGTDYGWSQLYLTAILLVAKGLHVEKKYRLLMAAAAWLVDAYLEKDKSQVTCSELVYRCFSEALPTPTYTIPGVSETILHASHVAALGSAPAAAASAPATSEEGGAALAARLPSASDLEAAAMKEIEQAGFDIPLEELQKLADDPALLESKLLRAMSPPEVLLSSADSVSGSTPFVIPQFVTPGDLQRATGLAPAFGRLAK